MLKTTTLENIDVANKKRVARSPNQRSSSAVTPIRVRNTRSPVGVKKPYERRCQSLSPSKIAFNKSIDRKIQPNTSAPEAYTSLNVYSYKTGEKSRDGSLEPVVPQCVVSKMMRILATKKREFLKLRKSLISQQNLVLENYAALKELEARAGAKCTDDPMGETRMLSVTGWPAHDLLMLIRDDLKLPASAEISGIFGPQVMQQLMSQLNPIPETVLNMGDELMGRRLDLLNLLRAKCKSDRSTYATNMEWKVKNNEFEAETEELHKMIAATAENLRAKLKFSLELAKVPWLDRDTLIKKIERLQKETAVLQTKVDELGKQTVNPNEGSHLRQTQSAHQAVCDELTKEKSAREALKDVVSSAESMLRVARARIATLERQLKDTKAELDTARKKHKDLEQLYRHRESSFDVRSKKLLEVSKTGEQTIEGLSRQRDALELRVKELHEQVEEKDKTAHDREAELRSRQEHLQAKVVEQEMHSNQADARVVELEVQVKSMEHQIQVLRERSVRLVDLERRRCLEYIPSKESEPSDRETELWKELQATRVALLRVEDELRQSRADKDNFLGSLNRLAQGEDPDSFRENMSTELLEREQKIAKLQRALEEQRENEKLMEQSMTQYENKLAALRIEIKRLRNYDCYAKDIPYQEMQTEILDLHMQVDSLSCERTSLVAAAASRALMLERHERAADYFTRMTFARRNLAALIDGRTEPPCIDDTSPAEISKSLSSVCASSAETWSALRTERARVLSLESAVLAQTTQLERESRVRTQLERRRASLERELLRAQHSNEHSNFTSSWNPSMTHGVYR